MTAQSGGHTRQLAGAAGSDELATKPIIIGCVKSFLRALAVLLLALPAALGQGLPDLGDVSDEEPDDDGALIAAGYASLTPLRSVTEETSAHIDDLVRNSLSAIAAHLDGHRSSSM